jgi:hypothetical protein
MQAYERPGSDPARLVAASLAGALQRHANWHQLTEAETAAAVAELRVIIGGRHDGPALLAEEAGLAIGAAEGRGEEYQAKARVIAELCRLAGADEQAIPAWTEEGRRRAEARRLPPFSQPGRRRPRQLRGYA